MGEDLSAEDAALEVENRALALMYTSQTDRIDKLAQNLQVINDMLTRIAGIVADQQELTQAITQRAEQSSENLEGATQHLNKAKERSLGYQFLLVCWFISASFVLLFLHWLI